MSNNKYIIKLIPNKEAQKTNVAVLSDVIGQKDAITKLSFFVQSNSMETPFPTTLFSGSQGLGKNYMAEKVARALGRKLVEINCGTIESSEEFIQNVIYGKILGNEPKTLLLDEAHKLSPEITTLLLGLLAPNENNINYISYNNCDIEWDLRNINVIFATTDAYKIFKPLLNRCVEIYFSLYSNDNLFSILKHYLTQSNISLNCNKSNIAYACRGRARDAFILTQNIKRYCMMKNIKTFDQNGWNELKNIFGIYPYGLNAQEAKLLRILRQHPSMSSNDLAIKMGINTNNLESEIETRPKELGFISTSARGRTITEAGARYLTLIPENA